MVSCIKQDQHLLENFLYEIKVLIYYWLAVLQALKYVVLQVRCWWNAKECCANKAYFLKTFIQEVTKEPRTTSKALQVSLASVQKPPLVKKEHKGTSHICKRCLDDPKDSWENIPCSYRSGISLEGVRAIIPLHHIIPAVKHGGGSVMVWGCVAASGQVLDDLL